MQNLLPNRVPQSDNCPVSFLVRVHLVTVLGLLLTTGVASAQPPKKPVVEEKTVVTEDRVELKLTYYKSISGKDSPVVVMLHGKRGTRLQWKGLASELQVKGEFAVVTVDLRGHGESSLKRAELKKTDYQAMAALDMEAVRDFLFEEHQRGQLNINRLGIVACDFSASVALVYTELDWGKQPYDDSPNPELRTPRGQDVRALALISPDTTTPGLMANKAAGGLRGLPIAIMIAASEKNTHDAAASKKLYDQLATKREKTENLYFEKYPEDVKGMDLVLQDPNIRSHIFVFLDKYVKQYQSEWRDRRSRLE